MTGITLLVSHEACLAHDSGGGHPESPARLRAVLTALQGDAFQALRRIDAPKAQEQDLALAHDPVHVAQVKAAQPRAGLAALDPDTIVSPGSWDAALYAAGAVMKAVDLVATGEAQNAFCAVRPPGHHAEPTASMGFCLFNSIAIGALHARRSHGLRRIAVVDFDVHHGNGTQAIFEPDSDLFFASTHQWGAYPGTGPTHETGVAGNILNLPMPPGCSGGPWRTAVSGSLLPRLRDFAPDLILISAGFDAHEADPLANMRLTAADFAWITTEICRVAADVCDGRVVSALEGGYDLPALASSVSAHVKALMAGVAEG